MSANIGFSWDTAIFNVAVGFVANMCNHVSDLRLDSQSVVLTCVLKITCEWWVC